MRSPSQPKPQETLQIVRERAESLRHRLRTYAWWRSVMHAHPGGVVPLKTACLMLGVSRQYISRMVQVGRLSRVEPPPAIGGYHLYPVDQLFVIGNAMERGRPLESSASSPGVRLRSDVIREDDYGIDCGKPTVPSGISESARKNFVERNPLWLEE